MFGSDFYPSPLSVIELMAEGEVIQNKIFLEPSCGKGDIVDYLFANGAQSVLGCELNDDLRKITSTKCQIIGTDFLKVESHQISHIDHIMMNPPFSADEKHILHAFDIAPAGCKITAICNLKTLKNPYTQARRLLLHIIEENGHYEELKDYFLEAERTTSVEVALIKIQKAGASTNAEFEGFFLEDEPEEVGENGIMPYNVIRDLVNRYVASVKIYDEQLSTAVKLNEMTSTFFGQKLGFQCTKERYQLSHNEFKKDLQKAGWMFIFNKMNMDKYATKGLKEDINKFVEKQTNIPFTMKNIYRMLEIVIGTNSQRMDKAVLEVFDNITRHHDDNKYNIEGWKTNSHYLLNKKFIVPDMCWQDQRWDKGKRKISTTNGKYFEMIEDFLKALCYLSGDNYDDFISLDNYIRYEFKLIENGKIIGCQYQQSYAESDRKGYEREGRTVFIKAIEPVYGEWFEWGYFRIKAYKKGTVHFEFKDENLWATFNQRVAKLKGYPLYEHNKSSNNKKNKTKEAA